VELQDLVAVVVDDFDGDAAGLGYWEQHGADEGLGAIEAR
jgi:hypothetical protein